MKQVIIGVGISLLLVVAVIVGVRSFGSGGERETETEIEIEIGDSTSSDSEDSTKEDILVSDVVLEQKLPATLGEKIIMFAEISAHNSPESCWTIIKGSVYDVTSFMRKHPGGSGAILRLCGVDGSSVFDNKHGGQEKQEAMLASFKIGELQK